MSAKRTQGELLVCPNYPSGMTSICTHTGTGWVEVGSAKTETDAHHFVVCWNACEPIADPENVVPRLLSLNERVPEMEHQIAALRVQRDELAARLEAGKAVWRQDQARIAELAADRDELLDALRKAIPALVQCERAYRSIGAAVGQGEFERALIKAQALVTKHQPPAAPAASTT